ncbi:MAG: ATP-dependent Clp protease proteolytic subunit [Nannocystaceae bacterium]
MADNKFTRLDDEIEYKLLSARRLFFSDGVDRDSSTEMIKKLWYLELTAPGEPITFIINSPGGSVDAGFAIWDQVMMISSSVTTVVTGMAASMGSILALCAPKGRRFATPRSRFMIHQPSMPHGIQGPAVDIEIHAEEIVKTREKITDLYAEITGQDRGVVAKALDRDTWLSPEEAKEFGLIDRVVSSFDELD